MVERSCFRTTGIISSRTIITRTMMAMPKLSKKTLARMIRKLSIGWSRTMFHKFTRPTVREAITRIKTTPNNIQFFLPNLGKTPLGICSLGLSVVIHHRRWT